MSRDCSATDNDRLKQRQRALARWDNEGGAQPSGPPTAASSVEADIAMPDNSPAEVASLYVRSSRLRT
jgi:hypothetical protein